MTEELSIFSTLEDVKRCSNKVLIAGIDNVARDVILAYILELRERLMQATLSISALSITAPSAPPESSALSEDNSYSAPPPAYLAASSTSCTPPAPPPNRDLGESSNAVTTEALASSSSGNDHEFESYPNESEWERQATMCKSSSAALRESNFNLTFQNETKKKVNVIWKDYDGNEEVVIENMSPSQTETIDCYYKFCLIVRNAATRKLLVFGYGGSWSVVFEGHNFGIKNDSEISIMSPDARHPCTMKRLTGYLTPIVHSPPNYEEGEQLVAQSKSINKVKKLKVRFNNLTTEVIDLIWIDYNGEEVKGRNMIMPGKEHTENTYFTHCFVARAKKTRQLRMFYQSMCPESAPCFVFEGYSNGVESSLKQANVDIKYNYNCESN